MSTSYVVITPIRNEAEHLAELVESMVAQTARPSIWVLVDDGSTDASAELISAAASEHEWIVGVQRPDRGFRSPGGGVVETFMSGYEVVRVDPWDFVVKFDADLAFAPDYFERCLAEFTRDERLGIAGGEVVSRLPDGSLIAESHPQFHVRGATKIYRRACWEGINGLVVAKGWDTIDEVKANQLGWATRTLSGIELIQQRETGHRAGSWRNWRKNGEAAWFCGYHPLFAAARASRVMTVRPYVLNGVAFTVGFGSSMLTRAVQVDDPGLIAYLRREQLNRLLRRPSIWR